MEFYKDDWLTIYQGDVRAVLPELASDSVDCIVTSPPYWGLRDYGTASWGGGDADCDHIEMAVGMSDKNTLGPDRHLPSTNAANVGRTLAYRHTCGKCGAVRQDSQLGLERTPEEYVANLVAIFRELRRVLKPSGTCWLNLGDSYNGSGAGGGGNRKGNEHGQHDALVGIGRPQDTGLKPKDLVGIPWRVAFALQADGWYLRSDIIWSKPNPMPESVTDRPTKAHEYLFLLTKSARYYFDADAVRESLSATTLDQWGDKAFERIGNPAAYAWEPNPKEKRVGNRNGAAHMASNPAGRNLRSVWTIATRPYPGAHFAVFPPELPERCIKAGSSERGVCPECGAPWERVVEVLPDSRTAYRTMGSPRPTPSGTGSLRAKVLREDGSGGDLARNEHRTTGWQPTCVWERHLSLPSWRGGESPEIVYPDSQPAVVLDPFAGSGTTGMVANRLSRRAILIDLNAEYLKQQMKRNAQTPMGLVV